METDLRESKWKQNFLANNISDVSGLWDIFKAKIHQLRDKYVPISSPEEPFWKTKGSVPLSLEVRNMMRKKSRLHRAWIRNQNDDNIATKASISPKSFWSHVRSKLKSKESVAPLYVQTMSRRQIEYQT